MKSKKNKAISLLMVFLLILFIAVFCQAMYEYSLYTNNTAEAREEVARANHLARVGVHFFAQKILQVSLNQSGDVLGELKKNLQKKMEFGGIGGWFRLDEVTKSGQDYLIKITGGTQINSTAAKAQPTLKLMDRAFAYGGGEYTAQYSALIGPDTFKSLSLITQFFQSHGKTAVYHYPGDVSTLSAQMENPPPPSKKISVSIDSEVTELVMEKIRSRATSHISQSRQAFWQGFQNPTKILSQAELDTRFPLKNNVRNIPSGIFDFSDSSFQPKSHLTLGQPATFSYMKFKKLDFATKGQKIRFYPGIYLLEELFLRRGATVFLDTTTGPIYLIVKKTWEIMGQNSSLLVFKDLDYRDKKGQNLDYQKYENKVDLANKGRENPLLYPKLSGRKIAQIFLDNSSGSRTDVNIDGQEVLLGALAVGEGGGNSVELPGQLSTFAGSEVGSTSGRFYADFTGSELASTEQLWIWGAEKVSLRIKPKSSALIFTGTLLLPFSRKKNRSKSGEFSIEGNDHKFYGIFVSNQLNIKGTNCSFYLDSRSYPFEPEIRPGSTYIKYMREIR